MKLETIKPALRLRFIADETSAPPAPRREREPATPVVTRILQALRAWAQARRERAIRQALAHLDAATLRDLGVHRSEGGSIAAEWVGRVELTRRRLAPRNVEVLARMRQPADVDYYR